MARNKPPFSDDIIARATELRGMYHTQHGTHCQLGMDEMADIMEHEPDNDKVLEAMHESEMKDTKTGADPHHGPKDE